ncbi:MAG: preprotein translocase subunit SecD [Deltaproteobacteria bacterium]|nr:preprotein translocase subunit SecD [Deltaproteobacteria bacterium]
MLKSLKIRFVLIGLFLLISVVFLAPNFVDLKGVWKRYLPSDKISLGLDLRGGMHLLLALDTDKMMGQLLDRKFDSLKQSMMLEGVRFLALDKKANSILVTVRADQKEKLNNLLAKQFPEMKVTETKAEGDLISVDLTILEKGLAEIKENAVRQALETIRNRIDQFGVSEPEIRQQGENRILVQLPGVKDPARALELIGRTAQLEFKLVDEDNMARVTSGSVPEGSEILTMKVRNRETGVESTSQILLKKQTLLTGELLTDARMRFGGDIGGETYVALEFNSEGARIFDRVTGENVGKRIAIVLDNTVYSAPVVRERISGGKASITGGFTVDEAKDLAIVLRAGALPAPVNVIYQVTIGPTLGQDSINKGIQATVLGGLLVIIFMVVYYRMSGVIANFALFLNLIYLLGAFSALRATMTLPGIAGIALTIGMGVDSNVLIFERIREELRLGKTVRAAVDGGYAKAWVAIFDSHITTLITACVLFGFGTGPIKGFAITLIIGMIINLFTAVFGSKAIFDWILQKYKPRTLSI